MNRIMNEIICDVKSLEHALPHKVMSAGKSTYIENMRGSDGSCVEDGLRLTWGWHDRILPPELRKACLSREEFTADQNTYLYILMSSWYERISGCRAPCNFEVYRDWKKKLRVGGRKNFRLSAQEISRLLLAIQEGTCFHRDRRKVKNVLVALTMPED